VKEPMSGQCTAGTLLCPRCKAAQMAEVTAIAPLLHEPGLIAFECPRCGHLTSIVQPPLIPHMADHGIERCCKNVRGRSDIER
jgi:hypothetical protein